MKVAVYDTKRYDRQYLGEATSQSDIEWHFFEFRLSTETAETASGFDAICAFVNDVLDADCLKKLAHGGCKMIALRCAGFNNVNLKAAKELGISVTRVPEYSPHAVAEHTVALLMTLNRKIHRAYNRVRELNFSLDGLIGFDLYGKTVGVVGTGRIGRLTAQLFRGFGCHIMAYDCYKSEEWAKENDVSYVGFNELLEKSDIVTLHVPLTKETDHLINKDSIALMKDTAYLINTSRGKLIDTTALIYALKERQIAGVALDVYEEEAGIFFEDHSHSILQDDELSRLITFPNVLITSHQAFLTHEALSEIARVTSTNLSRFSKGESFIEETQLQ